MNDFWYKNSIIYSLDVKTFKDANGDGIGDFAGLTASLDYLAALGVTCIWLLPFYPSSDHDNGYDVTDYYAVDPRLGTLGDVAEFMYQADERGIRVLADLVVNHTSDQHPWFQAARKDPNSEYRNYYIWSKEKPPHADQGVVFPGVQQSTWTYDEAAGEYYFHRFYKYQPDLSISDPEVRDEILKIMGFWLKLGVSGFRVDAAPFVIEMRGQDDSMRGEGYAYLREMHDFLTWRRGDAILLAEANVQPETIDQYFGNGDRMRMLFNFYVNQHIFLALASEQARPLIKAMQTVQSIPPQGQWAQFLRNHDELNLSRLSNEARQAVFAKYAPEERMRIYNRGIRRRLAPILGGNAQLLRLAYSLLFALPGTPVIWYGEEIGMGDDLSLAERNSVRTPMQWSDEQNGGFSTAPADKLIRPVIAEGLFSYERVNVAAEQRDPHSLLNWVGQLIRVRREYPHVGCGTAHILDTRSEHVMALRYEWHDSALITLHNLSHRACEVILDHEDGGIHFVELLGDQQYQPIEEGQQTFELGGYGYRWLRLAHA